MHAVLLLSKITFESSEFIYTKFNWKMFNTKIEYVNLYE